MEQVREEGEEGERRVEGRHRETTRGKEGGGRERGSFQKIDPISKKKKDQRHHL